jgi:5'-AMP-activated protein kinase catalytic alpha subunit
VQLYEVIETNEFILLVLEYASGGELFDYIVARGRLTEDQACLFYHQILDATEYIHEFRVVHRDLKPENLLLDEKNHIKLADFGLSNLYEYGQEMDTPCGSPCYAAPEMVAGKSYKGLNVDIWSSGVVLYAMVCGFLPFEDPSTPNLYQKIISGKYEEPNWLSPEVKDLMKKILNTNPEERFSIKNIRDHPWMAGKHPGFHIEPNIDSAILREVTSLGIDNDRLVQSLNENRKNSLTTLYFLLAKKRKNTVPRPPDSVSCQRIQKMHKIRYIETRKESRPMSRIKIVAKSVSPKAHAENRSINTQSRIRRLIQPPKEPETSQPRSFKRNNRVYKPIQTNSKLNFSYKITPKNYENTYRVKTINSFLTPKS